MQYWMYAATGGPNEKWGAPISNGGAGHHGFPAGDGLDQQLLGSCVKFRKTAVVLIKDSFRN